MRLTTTLSTNFADASSWVIHTPLYEPKRAEVRSLAIPRKDYYDALLRWSAKCRSSPAIVHIVPPETDAGPLLSMFLSAILGWCVFLPFTAAYLFSYIDARKRHKARQQASRTVTFSREGVWEAGLFFPLDKFLEANLKKVTLTLDPPVLHFRLTRFHLGKNWRASPTSATLHVPIPRGQEEDAGFLQERFQTEVIQARVQREKRLKNPPEPR